MTSTLAWLDHDAEARERAKRILALFQEQGTQDQLGIGSVRDAFSDLLFPGTSTIQTRLRYFLIVPWILQGLEREKTPSKRFASKARERELALISPLTAAGEEGVFGATAGTRLKRLPSEVYWGGLGEWGIRRFEGSLDRYFHAADDIYVRRKLSRSSSTEASTLQGSALTWHPDLPPVPESFPGQIDFRLTLGEAEFLRDRILADHANSLLAWLAVRGESTGVRFIWDHPLAEDFPAHNHEQVRQARRFSVVMAGAPYIYNWMLSREAARSSLIEQYEKDYTRWAEDLDTDELASWSVDDLFRMVVGHQRHRITPPTERFVRSWIDLVRSGAGDLLYDGAAHDLIRRREMALKGGRSLFRNRRALEERYNGGLGTGRLDYRWRNVEVLLNDLHSAGAAP